jgi:glycosyltransferase involved in cell wall biosynthesis
MVTMATYTIPICNYNMARTLRESLCSILCQLTAEYEVLVVDGGSTDGSVAILQNLAAEYQNFRYLTPDPDPDRHLGGDRAISVDEANGDYLLLHLDADDYYHEGIRDFVTVYHQIESQVERNLMLVGSHITMVGRQHLQDLGSYRNLRAAEDIDLWRRALADDNTLFLFLDEPKFWESIGYEKGPLDRHRRSVAMKSSEFQTGITLRSYLDWVHRQNSGWRLLYGLLTTLYSYGLALRRESLGGPDAYRSKSELARTIEDSKTFDELEAELGISVDLSELSEEGRAYFV